MKLYINEKLFSLHNKYNILDESGRNKYYIKNKLFTIAKKTYIYDMNDKEIIYAEQELFHFTAQYNVYIRGEYSYKIRKLFKFFKLDFELDNGYFVEGDFLSLDFKVFDFKHNEVARISRKFFSIGDKYEIIINDKSKLEILLSIIIVIINIIDERQASSNENI